MRSSSLARDGVDTTRLPGPVAEAERKCLAEASVPPYRGHMIFDTPTRDELVARLDRIQGLLISGRDAEALERLYSPDYVFHGSGGRDEDGESRREYFHSLRSAFDDLTVQYGIDVAEGSTLARQATIAGAFMREFTRAPGGPLAASGRRVVFDVIGIFRFDEQGLFAEEWERGGDQAL